VAELGVIGRAEDMHAVMDAERDATLAYLDGVTRERGGRRGRAGIRVATSGMVYAHSRHAISRAGDPCPHDHVLVANVVEMLDGAGRWKAGDEEPVPHHEVGGASCTAPPPLARECRIRTFTSGGDPSKVTRLPSFDISRPRSPRRR
jgi:hypothetical protein